MKNVVLLNKEMQLVMLGAMTDLDLRFNVCLVSLCSGAFVGGTTAAVADGGGQGKSGNSLLCLSSGLYSFDAQFACVCCCCGCCGCCCCRKDLFLWPLLLLALSLSDLVNLPLDFSFLSATSCCAVDILLLLAVGSFAAASLCFPGVFVPHDASTSGTLPPPKLRRDPVFPATTGTDASDDVSLCSGIIVNFLFEDTWRTLRSSSCSSSSDSRLCIIFLLSLFLLPLLPLLLLLLLLPPNLLIFPTPLEPVILLLLLLLS